VESPETVSPQLTFRTPTVALLHGVFQTLGANRHTAQLAEAAATTAHTLIPLSASTV